MPKIYVYDAYSNKMITYNLGENDTMPYSYGTTMKVKEFRGSSQSPTLWTTTAAMEAWNLTRRSYGKGIHIGYASSASGRAATAPAASTTRALHSTWARGRGPLPATPSGRQPKTPGPGAMWSPRT